MINHFVNIQIGLIQFLKDDHSYLAVEIINTNDIEYSLLNLSTENDSRVVV